MVVAYTGNAFTNEEKHEIIIDAIAVLLGDYSPYRKQAAILLLKALLPHRLAEIILMDDGVYPFDRNDPRVRKWTKEVLSFGRCELCGSAEHLEAHHIVKWADYPKGRADLKNGQCLCHNCHTEEHRYDQSYNMMAAKHYD